MYIILGSAFFHSAQFSGHLSRLLYVTILCSLLLLSIIPWNGYITVIAIHQLKDIWVVPLWAIMNKAEYLYSGCFCKR